MFDLKGKVALVTGSSRGIGKGIALALAEAGADIIVNCVGAVEAAEAVAEEIRAMGRKAWVKTFTLDGLSLSQDSPNNLVVVEFEGGGKMMTFLVGCQADEIYVGMPVVCTFRKMFTANGIHTYFWKAAPNRAGGEQA